MLPSLALLAVLCASSSPFALAFSFTTGTPTQCDDLPISWTGGTPPFQLFLTPAFGTPRNISVPSGSFSDGKGSFAFQLPLSENQKFVLAMSDATGFATGGNTLLMTVGASRGGTCDTKNPAIDFSFQLNSALQQCRPYVFSGFDNAEQPIRIIGTIPGGKPFELTPSPGPTVFTWIANVPASTTVLFTMVDSKGRNGGTSDLMIVATTDDATCLNNLSPTSTGSSNPQTTYNPTSSHTQDASNTSLPSSTTTPEPEKKTSIAAIAGTVIGALVFLAVAITVALFCLRKRRDNRKPPRAAFDLTYDPALHPNHPYSTGAAAASAAPLALIPGSGGYNAGPFSDSGSVYRQQPYEQSDYGASSSQYPAPSLYQPSVPPQPSTQYQSQYSLSSRYQQPLTTLETDPFDPYAIAHTQAGPTNIQPFDLRSSDQNSSADSVSMTTSQRKAAMAGVSAYTPSRFIMHTDVEDELPPPNQDGVVELPPQYSERRGPLNVANRSLATHRTS